MNFLPHEQMGLDFVEPEVMTLDNFVVGENAQLMSALRLCQQGIGPQFLYLWGPQGCGKTHLIQSLAGQSDSRVPSFKDKAMLYAVDDVDLLNETEAEELFILMNAVRAHPTARLVCTGAKPSQELIIREDIRSRLRWGLTFEIHYLDDLSTRNEFVRLAKTRGIDVTEEMEHWIQVHCPRDIQSLRQLLDNLDRYAIEKKRRVNVALMTQFVKERGFK